MIEISSALNTASEKLKALLEKIKEKLGIPRRQKELIDVLGNQDNRDNSGKQNSHENEPETGDKFTNSFSQYLEFINTCKTDPLKKKIFENIYSKIKGSPYRDGRFYTEVFPKIYEYLHDVTDLKEDENWCIYGYSKEYQRNVLFSVTKNWPTFKIPANIEILAPYSLWNYFWEDLTIPPNVNRIWDNVISSNTLKHLTIENPDSCSLEGTTFCYNPSLETVDIKSYSHIKNEIFSDCHSLKRFTAPQASIFDYVKFHNCGKLSKMEIFQINDEVKADLLRKHPNLTITTTAPKFTRPQ